VVQLIELPELKILGSSEQRFLGGMKSNFHCFEQNKVKALNESLNLNDYNQVIGYSDSASDIPLLSICHSKYIINPNQSSLIKFEKAFKTDMTVLNWV